MPEATCPLQYNLGTFGEPQGYGAHGVTCVARYGQGCLGWDSRSISVTACSGTPRRT
jgi:hypothetical protein